MPFKLKITKNCKSVFEKRHYDVTSVCPSPPNFSETCVNKFYPKSS